MKRTTLEKFIAMNGPPVYRRNRQLRKRIISGLVVVKDEVQIVPGKRDRLRERLKARNWRQKRSVARDHQRERSAARGIFGERS